MTKYARGSKAWGICDRTGFRYLLDDLVYEVQNGVRTGLRVGYDVVDPDHPQNHIGEVRVDEPQSLRDPRPDVAVESLYGWNPVGNSAESLLAKVGKVTVTTS